MTFRNHIYFLIFLIHRDVLTVAIKSRHSQAYLRIGMTKQYDFMVDLVKILIVKEEDSVKMLYFLTYVYGMDSVSPLQTRSLFRRDLFISSSFTLDDQAFVFRKKIYFCIFYEFLLGRCKFRYSVSHMFLRSSPYIPYIRI